MSRGTVINPDSDRVFGFTLDEHDRRGDSGVRQKELMQRIAEIALKKLTDRQRSVYIRFYVEMKSVAEIAAEDGIHISAVYRHLRKAEKNFFELKELVLLESGKKLTLCDFKNELDRLTPALKKVANDYYINGLKAVDIAEKYGITYDKAQKKISAVRNRFKYSGLTSADLKVIRKMLSTGVRVNE